MTEKSFRSPHACNGRGCLEIILVDLVTASESQLPYKTGNAPHRLHGFEYPESTPFILLFNLSGGKRTDVDNSAVFKGNLCRSVFGLNAISLGKGMPYRLFERTVSFGP